MKYMYAKIIVLLCACSPVLDAETSDNSSYSVERIVDDAFLLGVKKLDLASSFGFEQASLENGVDTQSYTGTLAMNYGLKSWLELESTISQSWIKSYSRSTQNTLNNQSISSMSLGVNIRPEKTRITLSPGVTYSDKFGLGWGLSIQNSHIIPPVVFYYGATIRDVKNRLQYGAFAGYAFQVNGEISLGIETYLGKRDDLRSLDSRLSLPIGIEVKDSHYMLFRPSLSFGGDREEFQARLTYVIEF